MTDRQRPPASQTLSRGLTILECLAGGTPLAVDAIAMRLGVHRSIAYRLVRTLEDHGMVARDASGRVMLGMRLATLAASVAGGLADASRPPLAAAADDLAMTCFLAVRDRDDCVTLSSAEPSRAVASVAQRPGARHAVTVGAPGKAILAATPRSSWPARIPDELIGDVDACQTRGFATSHDEVIPSVRAVAVPLRVPGHEPAAIAALYVGADADVDMVATRLGQAATDVAAALGG